MKRIVLAIGLFAIGCGEFRREATNEAGSADSQTAAFACPTKPDLLAPLYGDRGLPHYEGRVHACRRFGPGTYSSAKIGWRTDAYMCALPPSFTWAKGSPDAIDGFSFAPHVAVPASGKVAFHAEVPEGMSLFACAVLKVVLPDRRSCIEACRNGGDPDSFWGNTGPDGIVVNPPELEPLSASPSAEEADVAGRDGRRLMIDASPE